MTESATLSRSIRVRLIRAGILLAAFSLVFSLGIGVGLYRWGPLSALKAPKADAEVKAYERKQLHRSPGEAYALTSHRLSYWALDSTGNPKLQNSLPYRAEGMYKFDHTINPNETAIVVMDPWVDMGTEHLNKYYVKIAESRVIPLVMRSLTRGHPIIMLTNDPDKINYAAKIYPQLETLVEKDKATLLFHQDWTDVDFAAYLHSQGIKSLIYIGFASNMCVIGRRMGMIPMTNRGFQIFFVPEASAAVEYADTWDDQSIHKAATKIISQGFAEIIDYDEFMKVFVASR